MKKYQAGGTTTASMLGQSSSLSPYAGPYVTGMLGKGAALSELPYQAYMGPLTAGQSALQTQAFQGLANLTVPTSSQMSYTPMSFTGSSFAQPMGQQGMGGFPTPYQMPMPQQPMGQQDMGGYRLPTAAEQARMDQESRANARPVPTMDEMARQMAEVPVFEGGAQAQRSTAPYGISIDPSMFSSLNTTTASDMGMTFDPATRTITSTGTGQVSEGYPSQAQRQAQAPAIDFASRGRSLQQGIAEGKGDTFDDMSMAFGPITSTGTGQVSEGYPSQAQRQAQIQAPAMPQAQPQAQPSATSILEQYMTPYLQGALDPQYAAAQRQAEIAAQQLQSQFGKAGAYGGSRQGVAEAELQRGLLDRMAGITGQGYQQAFEQAQQQFNTEQQRQMAATGQAQQYGLQALGAQRLGGAEQRAIEGQGIAADIAQFKEERDYPYKQVQYQQSLLQGLPISTQSYQYAEPSTLSNVMSGAGGILGLLETLGIVGK